jgi:GTP-binding protein
MAKAISWKAAKFIGSWPEIDQLPKKRSVEVAMVGRSNVGKSSLLNAFCEQSKLAKVSSTPGKTQAFVLFDIDEHVRLVDLPGYGFAKVPLDLKKQWSQVTAYLEQRATIILLLIDIRHGLQAYDIEFIKWLEKTEHLVEIILTKADKLSNNQKKIQQDKIKQQLAPNTPLHTVSQKDFQSIQNLQIALSEHTLNYLHSHFRA